MSLRRVGSYLLPDTLERLPITRAAFHRLLPRPQNRRAGRTISELIAQDASVDDFAEALNELDLIRSRLCLVLDSIQDNAPSDCAVQNVRLCPGSYQFFDLQCGVSMGGDLYSQDYADDNFCTCEDCESTVETSDTTSIHDRCVCDDCRDRDYTRCDSCLEYDCESEMTTVNGRAHVCRGCIDNGGYYYWELDGEYHSDPEPDEDGDENDNGLSGYHGITRPGWWKNPAAHHGVSAKVPCFGVELELDCNNIPALLQRIGGLDLLAEEDGSLRDTGLELIGGPYTLAQYQSHETPWHKFSQLVDGCKGHAAHTDAWPYGIHVSISRSSFVSELHLSKFVVFLNIAEQLGKTIAQRTAIYNGRYKARCKCGRKALDTSKYEPANVGTHRVEVRIFRSNLREDRIVKNVEYVASAHEFSRDVSLASLADETTAASAFIGWLANRPGDYPHLVEFLGGTAYRAPFAKWIDNRTSPSKKA